MKMENKEIRKSWGCPKNVAHNVHWFEIMTTEKPPLCPICGSKLIEEKNGN